VDARFILRAGRADFARAIVRRKRVETFSEMLIRCATKALENEANGILFRGRPKLDSDWPRETGSTSAQVN